MLRPRKAVTTTLLYVYFEPAMSGNLTGIIILTVGKQAGFFRGFRAGTVSRLN